MSTKRTRSWKAETGQELVEMALTLPLLLVVVLAIVDFGLLFQQYEIITNGAREGVRLAARVEATDAEVEARVANYIAAAGLTGTPSVSVTPTTISAAGLNWPAAQVSVTYDHDFVFLGPVAGFLGGSFTTVTLSAQSTMRTELAAPGTP